MKKHILFAGVAMLVATVAIAKTIDFDTPVRWNPLVIRTSLNDVGLFGGSGYHYDVVATYDRILEDLLKRDTFSCRTATEVCMQQCNKSDLLRNGRGSSGRKCPDICKEFANALINNNNKNITYRLASSSRGGPYDCDGRVYSDDKKFYAIEKTGAVFDIYESSSNRKIGTTGSFEGEDGAYGAEVNISGGNYDGWNFYVYGGISLIDAYDEFGCGLQYESVESKYIWLKERLEEEINELESAQKRVKAWGTVDNSDGVIKTSVIKSPSWFQDVNKEIDSLLKELYTIKNAPVSSVSYMKGMEYLESSDYRKRRGIIISDSLDADNNDRAVKSANCVRELFKNGTNSFKYTRTDTKEDAYRQIKDFCSESGIWLNAMSCSGECKKLGDDEVTCHIGSLSATFVFDSICRTIKDKLF